MDQTAILQILNQAQQLMKHLGFESNTAKYERETLIHVFQSLELLLWDLWGSITF